MKLPRREFLHLAAGAAALPAVSRIARAQAYPTRPVRVVVPYAPGGPTDLFGRLIAQKLSEHLGKQFYVENIVGANGNIGMGRAAKAAADGYTILAISPSYTTNPALYNNVPYDPYEDFDPIAVAVTNPLLVTINPSVPAQTVKDLFALIKANLGKYNYATGGTGSVAHLVGEQLRRSLGLDLVHIPYNSAGLALGSVVAGHTPIYIGSPAPALSQTEEGKLRALAGTGKTRWKTLPGVPTMAEVGYTDIEGENWQAVLVPAGTPKEIITLLNQEIIKIVMLPDIKERMAALGFEPVAKTPDESAFQIRAEIARWTKIIRAANIKAE
jgi:tripartite-type tricarboxylate transporter receptor subunit TctC